MTDSTAPGSTRVHPTLAHGQHSRDVGELRRRLALLGHVTDPDPRDTFGDATCAAVKEFQDARGLDPTGVCDAATWSALVESEHQLGDRLLCLRTPMVRGEDVADLQLRLGTLGFDSGRVDGIFGPATQSAVGEFQRNAGIVFDQVCGPDTVAALRRLEGRAGSSTIASVRERMTVRSTRIDMSDLRVVVGAAHEADLLSGRLAARLSSICGDVALAEGDASLQARTANDFDADLFVGIEFTDSDEIEARFFSVPGFESYGGRALAEAMVRHLPATGLVVARGMRLPILRETRAPAVSLRLGHGLGAPQHRELLVESLVRAISHWRDT
ncbi:MAG: peptidoglycan-binding protein [Microthrixaceae bacterium]|nr:peptidoglycan-binding protein [Microthrixaceae bacterium]MCO5318310.1 peptidoglycan-binding protein [Microthrixaceae bacterium]